MSVEVSPRDYLGFRRPFKQAVTSHLTLRNPHHKPIVVKIKVTSPKAYCVRPNSSRIEPGESLDISVILQPMKEQPPANAKCKDKFLVCSAEIPVEKESMALTDYWYELEKTDKNKIQEHKLRVAYLSDTETIPEDSVGDSSSRWADETQTAGGFASPAASKMMSGDASTPTGTPKSNGAVHASLPYPATPIHVTNVQTQNVPPAPTVPVPSGSDAAPSSTYDPAQVAKSMAGPGTLSTPSKSTNSVPRAEINSLSGKDASDKAQGAASSLVHTAEEQLAHARAQILQLQSQLSSSDLGQRVKGAVGDVQAKAAQVIPPQVAENVEGYQLTVVLAVAFAAFSIGYLWHSWA